MSDIAIKVENLSKAYQLGDFGTGTLSRDLERWWALMRGKEDPFLMIGETNDRTLKGQSDIVWSLKDINFEINEGDAVGIIGRNGAGKSTLLKVLSRVTSPTTGNIKVKGRIASLLEVGTGFHPELTGGENIYLNGAIMGMSKREIKKKFDEIVDFAGVERYVDTPVKRYSSGMYVRLAFAVAAHLDSEILVIDEVLAVGDAEFQKKCLGKMNDVSKGQGRTVLFVSHNMGSISQLCNNAILLKNGEVFSQGKADIITNQYINLGSEIAERYIVSKDEIINKKIFITEVFTANIRGEYTNSYDFFEPICLKIKIHIQDYDDNALIGIALLDKYQNRVFTIHKNINSFKQTTGALSINIKLQEGLIAPNNYSFIIAAFIPNKEIFDIIENVCPIQIHDTGTDFALVEGTDYGNVLINSTWAKDSI